MSCALLGPPEELNEEIDIKTLPDLQKEGTQVNGIQDEWFGIKYKTLSFLRLQLVGRHVCIRSHCTT